MKLSLKFLNRDFTAVLPREDLRYTIQSMSWAAVGGCRDCTIRVSGAEEALWEMIEYLRYGVEIRDELGGEVWWGCVAEVEVGIGGMAIGATLDTMSNDVAVAYSLAQTDKKTIGYRKTTTWVDDDDSVAEYGRKQFLSSQGNLSDAAATARRDAILAAKKYPQGTCNPFGGGREAVLTCRGWWDTLAWQYATIPAVTGMSYSTTSATEQAVGSASSNQRVMQAVNLGGRALQALGLSVYARKIGSPTDNLTISLYLLDDNTDIPSGSALGTVTLAGSGIGTSLAWLSGTFTGVQLDPQKDYGIVVARSGAVNGTNYYVVNVNEALGDPNGFFKIYDGTNWSDRSPDADMPYIISKDNLVESTNQIKELARTFGEFITYVDVENGSGVLLPSYRDGDTLALDEIEALLQSGGANGRRMLAEVKLDRTLRVWEEPASSPIYYKVTRQGKVLGITEMPIEDTRPPIGAWCRLYDVIPANADISKLNSPEIQFIEGASWDPAGGLKLEFRGTGSIDELFEVER
jgi:hypothetical protein